MQYFVSGIGAEASWSIAHAIACPPPLNHHINALEYAHELAT